MRIIVNLIITIWIIKTLIYLFEFSIWLFEHFERIILYESIVNRILHWNLLRVNKHPIHFIPRYQIFNAELKTYHGNIDPNWNQSIRHFILNNKTHITVVWIVLNSVERQRDTTHIKYPTYIALHIPQPANQPYRTVNIFRAVK